MVLEKYVYYITPNMKVSNGDVPMLVIKIFGKDSLKKQSLPVSSQLHNGEDCSLILNASDETEELKCNIFTKKNIYHHV